MRYALALPIVVLALVAGCAHRAPAVAPPSGAIDEAAQRRGAEVVLAAMAYLDTPYRLGGDNHAQGFDCSGFTRHVYAGTLGLTLPRRAEDQAAARALRDVDRGELAPGDLVFFNTLRHAYSHVGIYLGDGRFIHAPRTGASIRVEDMRSRYWTTRYDGARRAAPAEAPLGPTAVAP
jgi:cell wall-associated NlpC family hydrolase